MQRAKPSAIAPRIGRPARARRRDRSSRSFSRAVSANATDRDRFRINSRRGNAEGIKIAVDQAGIELLGAKIGWSIRALRKRVVGFRSGNGGIRQRKAQAVSTPSRDPGHVRDDFRDHRIVEERRHSPPSATPESMRRPSPCGRRRACSLPVDGRKPRSGSSA